MRVLAAIAIALLAMSYVAFPIYWQYGAAMFAWPQVGILAWGFAPMTVIVALVAYHFWLPRKTPVTSVQMEKP